MTYYYHHPQRKQAKKGPLCRFSSRETKSCQRNTRQKDALIKIIAHKMRASTFCFCYTVKHPDFEVQQFNRERLEIAFVTQKNREILKCTILAIKLKKPNKIKLNPTLYTT